MVLKLVLPNYTEVEYMDATADIRKLDQNPQKTETMPPSLVRDAVLWLRNFEENEPG